MGVSDEKHTAAGNTARYLDSGMEYRFIESFCGPGGMSLGLERAGLKPTIAFDADDKAVETHRRNLPGDCFVADARLLNGDELLLRSGCAAGMLALLSGGPPCQGFSKQRRGAHLGDERNGLILEYVRLVRETEPRFFLFENVAIFGQKRGKRYVAEMSSQLGDYVLKPHFYNCADYGLPQTRMRFVVVGRRADQRATFRPPRPTVERWATVGEVIGDLPEPPEDYSVHPEFPNHQRARVTKLNIERFSHVPQGGGWQDIPEDLRLDCHKGLDTRSGGWTDVYGRLESDGQCPTITGGFDSFTRGRYAHPTHDRPLTPR